MSILTTTGLASGIDTGSLIEQLLAIEARPRQLAERRVLELQREQAAFLDINSALLRLSTAAEAFRLDDVFDASNATSSNSSVIGATVTGNPPAGQFDFVVDRLVSTQRRLSRGFTDLDVSGLGLSRLSFEQGGGNVSVDTSLSELRGGAGIERGKIRITDRSGASAEVDLSRVGTVNEVLDAINATAGVSVTARTDGDGFVIEDTSGGGGNLRIESVFGSSAAESLGIAANVASSTVTGENLRTLSENTALSLLNDGVGVLVRDGTTDFTIGTRSGVTLNIDLGEQTQEVLREDFLYDGVTYTAGTAVTDIPGVTSASDLVVLNGDFEFDGVTYDNGTPLSVLEALPGFDDLDADERPTTTAAATDRDTLIARATTIGDVIEAIERTASDAGVDVTAAISADGRGLVITDNTGGGGNLTISNGPSGDTAEALGLVADVAAGTVTSRDLIGDINSVLNTSLNGGRGLSVSDFELTDRNGLTTDLSGIDVSGSLSDLIGRVNTQLEADGNTLRARVNSAGNGVAFDDIGSGTGGITIEGGLAEELRIDVDGFAGGSYEGRSAELKWIGLNTRLSDLNNGSGIGTGEIRITDSLGVSRTIDITSNENTGTQTVDDLIRRINSTPEIGVTASLNAGGDGIVLTDTAGGSGDLVIEDVEGTVADALNIAGTFTDSGSGLFVDGSYERVLEFKATDTLDDVVTAINDAGVGVIASIVNDGSANSPFRLSLTSRDTGRDGRVILDTGGVDLGLNITDEGENARVFFGSDDPAEGVLIDSSTNSLSGVIQGVTLDLASRSDDPVTVTVSQDDGVVEEAAQAFVDAFNAVIDTFDRYDTYNEATEQAGVLLGDGTVSNVRRRLYDSVQRQALNVDSQFRFLFEVGIRIGEGARLELNTERFREALERDRDGVTQLVSGFRQAPNDPIEVAPGAFVTPTEASFDTLGVAEIIAQVVEDMTNSIDGTLTNRDDTLQRQIDLQESRIENFDVQLDNKRAQLQAEFLAMERAIASLQSQQAALSQLGGASLAG